MRTSAALLTGLALVVTSAGPVLAADPVGPGQIDTSLTTINLLNINDFHGRIDDNNTGAKGLAFACTVETAKATLGEDSTLFLSAGDNIGATPFTSASQDDAPTIEVLDALGLDASAIGNHELDRGYADLTGRVDSLADFPYLGANVYRAGTTTPALQEYATFEVSGHTVAVIGAVTQDTASLVSPAGIAGIEFGDPVAAVNRVAAQLSDGNAANGEADVIVAEYHEGAVEGGATSTLTGEVADGGAFARIVTQTTAEVDAIFTGHTHQQYAWDAPVPGGTGTRPIVQTGSYADTLGQVQLGVDADGDLVQYSATLLPRLSSTAGCATDPQYLAAKSIIDTAVARAKALGSVVVGSVTDDITTALKPDGSRDDRAGESSLGNLTAQVWYDSLNAEGRSGADLGIMNPGGLRADLTYAPSGTEAPGEVTYAEAAAVNPFANTVMTVDITGAQLDTLLEQQWQPAGSSRPYLALGLSDNVAYTFDPDAPKGEHITSIYLDGAPVDPAASYTVASSSFLITGGDNFTVLAQGTNLRDSGLSDSQAFVDWFKANTPVSPDYSSRSVAIDPTPATLVTGTTSTFTVSDLDLTSRDAVHARTVEVFLDGRSVGTYPVTSGPVDPTTLPVLDGTAQVAITLPRSTKPGPAELYLRADNGTDAWVPVTVVRGTGKPSKPGKS